MSIVQNTGEAKLDFARSWKSLELLADKAIRRQGLLGTEKMSGFAAAPDNTNSVTGLGQVGVTATVETDDPSPVSDRYIRLQCNGGAAARGELIAVGSVGDVVRIEFWHRAGGLRDDATQVLALTAGLRAMRTTQTSSGPYITLNDTAWTRKIIYAVMTSTTGRLRLYANSSGGDATSYLDIDYVSVRKLNSDPEWNGALLGTSNRVVCFTEFRGEALGLRAVSAIDTRKAGGKCARVFGSVESEERHLQQCAFASSVLREAASLGDWVPAGGSYTSVIAGSTDDGSEGRKQASLTAQIGSTFTAYSRTFSGFVIGRTYTFRIRYKISNGREQALVISGPPNRTVELGGADEGVWTETSFDWVATVTSSIVRIYACRTAAPGLESITVSEFSVTHDGEMNQGSNAAAPDGVTETNGVGTWAYNGAGTGAGGSFTSVAIASDDHGAGGSYALRLLLGTSPGANSRITQAFSVEESTTYLLSFWYKVEQPNEQKLSVSGTSGWSDVTLDSEVWEFRAVPFTVSGGFTSVNITFYCATTGGAGGDAIWFDRVSLRKVESGSPAMVSDGLGNIDPGSFQGLWDFSSNLYQDRDLEPVTVSPGYIELSSSPSAAPDYAGDRLFQKGSNAIGEVDTLPRGGMFCPVDVFDFRFLPEGGIETSFDATYGHVGIMFTGNGSDPEPEAVFTGRTWTIKRVSSDDNSYVGCGPATSESVEVTFRGVRKTSGSWQRASWSGSGTWNSVAGPGVTALSANVIGDPLDCVGFSGGLVCDNMDGANVTYCFHTTSDGFTGGPGGSGTVVSKNAFVLGSDGPWTHTRIVGKAFGSGLMVSEWYVFQTSEFPRQ